MSVPMGQPCRRRLRRRLRCRDRRPPVLRHVTTVCPPGASRSRTRHHVWCRRSTSRRVRSSHARATAVATQSTDVIWSDQPAQQYSWEPSTVSDASNHSFNGRALRRVTASRWSDIREQPPRASAATPDTSPRVGAPGSTTGGLVLTVEPVRTHPRTRPRRRP